MYQCVKSLKSHSWHWILPNKNCPNFCCEDKLSIEALWTKHSRIRLSDPSTTDAAGGISLVFLTEGPCTIRLDDAQRILPVFLHFKDQSSTRKFNFTVVITLHSLCCTLMETSCWLRIETHHIPYKSMVWYTWKPTWMVDVYDGFDVGKDTGHIDAEGIWLNTWGHRFGTADPIDARTSICTLSSKVSGT